MKGDRSNSRPPLVRLARNPKHPIVSSVGRSRLGPKVPGARGGAPAFPLKL